MAGKDTSPSKVREAVTKEMLTLLPKLKAFAISLSKNQASAEDLVQDTVQRAIANLDSFEPGTNLQAWLFTILRNRFRSNYRKRKREVEWNPDFDNSASLSTGFEQGEAEATYDFRVLLSNLACVNLEQSDALVAVGYLGMSYEEAAERLGCAVGTIKSRVNRAREHLQRLMRGSVVKRIDLTSLKSATQGVPSTHPYFPIARAYEEMFAAFEMRKVRDKGESRKDSASEVAWRRLVDSGALDEISDEFLSDSPPRGE